MTHACYLLRSLNPRFRTRFYIGCTTDPRRRLRQHNGERGQGAHFTKAKRPWEMVLCVYGFSSHVNALKFEWAWQHPLESIAVREAAAKLPSLKGVPGMITLVCTMVTLPQWNSLNLTLQFMLSNLLQYRHGSPPLPPQMQLVVDSMNSLPGKDSQDGNDDCENLSTCPDNLSQSEQLDEVCSINASTSNVCGEGIIRELSSTAELNTSQDRTAPPCVKTNESNRVQITVTEEILVGEKSVKSVVHLQQKSLTFAFPERKQAAVPKSIHRQAGNDEMYKVWEHFNNRKPPEVVAQGKHAGPFRLKSLKEESVQDAVLVIVSDEDDDELQEISVIPEHSSTVELYTSHERTGSPCAKPNESDRVQITVTEKISVGGGSVTGVQLQQKFLTDAFPVRKQAAAPKSIYRKARNGEVYKVLEERSNNRKPPKVVAQGQHSGPFYSKSSKGGSIQDAVLLIDSDDGGDDDDDDDEIQEISVHEFQQSNLFGASRSTRRKETDCSLSDFR